MGLIQERRSGQSVSVLGKHANPLGLSRTMAWYIVAFGAALTTIADLATGPDVWLGPAYLIAICAAGWALGWREALGVAFGCMGLTILTSGLMLFPFGTASAVWNFAMRWLVVLALIGFLELMRRSYLREWRLARTDLLTGALNRQAFFEVASVPSHVPSWAVIAYADLDGFKQINDEHGHAVGDEALRAFAAKVRSSIRTDDLFARLGGDEFVICMNVRDHEAAKQVAARLHRAVNAALDSVAQAASCSLGVLILAPDYARIADYITSADKLMYEAKNLRGSLVVATLTKPAGELYRHWDLTPSVPQVIIDRTRAADQVAA